MDVMCSIKLLGPRDEMVQLFFRSVTLLTENRVTLSALIERTQITKKKSLVSLFYYFPMKEYVMKRGKDGVSTFLVHQRKLETMRVKT